MKLNFRAISAAALVLAFPAALIAAETETKPAEKPAAKPAEAAAKPADVKPAETKPAETKPADTKAAPAPAAKKEGAVAKDPMHPVVVVKTSLGEIKIKLDKEKAPITTENFVKYVEQKFYDGTTFHRVISNFMIQGGGFTPDMTQKKPNAEIKLEAQNGLKNKRGTVAMARTSAPNSATSQFFINVVDNENLDFPKPDGNGYAVFGAVIEGMDVVDKIKAVPTASNGPHQNVPSTAVMIESVTLQ